MQRETNNVKQMFVPRYEIIKTETLAFGGAKV